MFVKKNKSMSWRCNFDILYSQPVDVIKEKQDIDFALNYFLFLLFTNYFRINYFAIIIF